MADPIRAARSRVLRDSYIDGLSEIAAAVLPLLGVGLLLGPHWAPTGSPQRQILFWSYIVLFFTFVLFKQRVLHAIRERFTYPRTGYVTYCEPRKAHQLGIGTVATLLTIAAFVVSFRFHGRMAGWENWMPALIGVPWGTWLIVAGLRVSLPRFVLVGALSIILGLGVSFAWSNLYTALTVYLAGMGCALLVSGTITLWRYVHTAPPRSEQA